MVFLLLRIEENLNQEEQALIKNVLPAVRKRLEHYQNKDGEPSYNFWRTRPSAHWPFGMFAHRHRFFQIPDDIDDSALAHLILGSNQQQVESLRKKMIRYANVNIGRHNPHAFPEYRSKKIYNTFFIKNMPCSFDFCALTNVMYLFHQKGLPPCEEDNDSRFFLRQSILSGQFLTNPSAISPYYPDSAIILYHAVRAADCIFSGAEKEAILLPLLQDSFDKCRQPVQKMMLASSLLKMGKNPGDFLLPDQSKLDEFVFFVAGLFGEFHSPFIRSLHRFGLTHVRYYCRAFSQALLFEFLVLRRGFIQADR